MAKLAITHLCKDFFGIKVAMDIIDCLLMAKNHHIFNFEENS